MFDWFRLTRASGLFTVASNLLAAVAVAVYTRSLEERILGRQLAGAGADVLWVIVTSCLLLLGGMVWNDLADLERDRELHPRRPLAAGRISPLSAWFAGLFLVSGALLCAAPLGYRGIYGAGVVLSLSLIYNFLTKQVPYLGSLTMAAVRFAFAVFALLALGPEYFDRTVLAIVSLLSLRPTDGRYNLPIYPAALGIYVFGVTLLSELESRRGRRCELLLGGAIVLAAYGYGGYRLFAAHWLHDPLRRSSFFAWLGVLAFLAVGVFACWRFLRSWLRAVRSARRADVGPSVGVALGGMLLFDALLAASGHPLIGLAILLLFLPFVIVAAAVRMD
ncbi:MAG: UbiA family prenyltransferase [Planctomycetota bacterium]